ncbi:unnamed protein product [Rotaria sp. Silwood2]|nr:unnamed protein product [Rotaria sp. Silwood2]
MITTSIDTTESLPLVLLLSQCLILLETLSEINENLGHALSTLQSLFKDSVLRQILAKLHQYIDYFSRIFVWIERKEILELILNFELERIISNKRQSSKITTRPYLLMIEDLYIYLIEHLRLYVDVKTEIENSIKEEFLVIIIKWITNC